jgi:hypothetical protein
MIFRDKLRNLTEIEYSILYYCLNDGTDGDFISSEHMVLIKPHLAFLKLNEYAGKVPFEKRQIFQSIVDKLESQ